MIIPELIEIKVIDNFTINEIHVHKNYSVKEADSSQVKNLLQDSGFRYEVGFSRCKTIVSKPDAQWFIDQLKKSGFLLIQIKQL